MESEVGYMMERSDMMVVGDKGVVENVEIFNNMGTYTMGILARDLGKSFYMAANSYKFARLFSLNWSVKLRRHGNMGRSQGW